MVEKQLFYDEIDMRHEKRKSFWNGILAAVVSLIIFAVVLELI